MVDLQCIKTYGLSDQFSIFLKRIYYTTRLEPIGEIIFERKHRAHEGHEKKVVLLISARTHTNYRVPNFLDEPFLNPVSALSFRRSSRKCLCTPSTLSAMLAETPGTAFYLIIISVIILFAKINDCLQSGGISIVFTRCLLTHLYTDLLVCTAFLDLPICYQSVYPYCTWVVFILPVLL